MMTDHASMLQRDAIASVPRQRCEEGLRRLGRTRAGRVLRVLAVGVMLPAVAASHAGEVTVVPSAKFDARTWLERIGRAASTVNFQGTVVFSNGSHVSTSRQSRFCQGKDSYEHSVSLDGPPKLVFRHNQLVHTLWPARKVAVVEQREALLPFASLASGAKDLLAVYDVRLDGIDRVAGHAAQVLTLAPRDAHRFTQRIWAHEATGLMLRAEVLDADQRVLESMAFSDLKTGIRAQPEQVTQPMRKLEGYQVVSTPMARTQLEAEGWKLDVPVAGFKQISCVKRPVDGGAAMGQGPVIVQAIYSDGLVHVSVFIEPFVADRHRAKASTYGATRTLEQRRDDAWVTVVGDVPVQTIKQFSAALQRRP